MKKLRCVELVLATLLTCVLAADLVFAPPLPQHDQGTVIMARDGTPLRTYPSPDGVWRQPITPEEVSPLYLQALLAYEDRWFYWHPGVNPWALARAAWQWVRTGRIVSGGSTLTMQLARILDAPPPREARTFKTKVRQILRALQIELRLSKREILILYLNHAPMGGIVEGVEMASRTYLGKASKTLSPAEAALLTSLPQAPSRLRPDRHPQAAQKARDKVLDRMVQFGIWPGQVALDARLEHIAVQAIQAQWLAPLAAERVRSANRQKQTILRTTIDPELQAEIERMLLDRVNILPPKVSMAAMVMHNDTLEVLAYAGSADFKDNQRAAHVDMVRGVRSPGSTLKPFLYAMALDEGLIHSESLLVDAPQSFGGYQPGNFQANFSGPVSVSEALQKSLNVPAVDLLDRLSPVRFASVLRAGGVKLRMQQGVQANLSLILGGAGTTLEELVGAYRALARGGLSGLPRLTPNAPRREARLMSAGAAFIVRDILEGGGHPERPFTEGTRRLAWKTGTSFGFRDAWAVGVTDHYTLGVWIGRPDGTPNPGFFGANVAAPLLQDIITMLPEVALPRKRPASVSAMTTCWPLGLRIEATAPEQCLVRHTGWVLQQTAPPTLPDRSRSQGLAITSYQCNTGKKQPDAVRWPVALEPWISSPEKNPACETHDTSTALRIVGLETGAVLRPVPGQQHVDIQVQAQGIQSRNETLYWLVDGHQYQHSQNQHAVTIRLNQSGAHSMTVMDSAGRYHRVDFMVSGM